MNINLLGTILPFSVVFFFRFFAIFLMALIIYFRYYRIPKNPILYGVVNYLPLQFIGFLVFFFQGTVEALDLPQAAPIEWEQAPAPMPDIPVLEEPLIPDDQFRRIELNRRLGPHSFVRQDISLRNMVDLVYRQADIEKRIEAALVHDGISRVRVLIELNRLRGVLFYPRGEPLSPATLARHLEQIALNGTRNSVPYRRVISAIKRYELFIDLIFFFNNNNNNQ